jgi:hypothetical protein
MTSRATAHGYSHGDSSISGAGSGLGVASATTASESLARDAASDAGTYTTGSVDGASSLSSQFSAEGTNDAETDVEIESEGSAHTTSSVKAQSVGKGVALSGAESRAVTEGTIVVPTDVFYEASYQIEPLETQLARHQSVLVRQPDRTLTIASDTGRPTTIRTLDVPDPKLSASQMRELERRRVAKEPHYALPAEVDAEIAQRQAKLLCVQSEAVMLEDPIPSDDELRERLARELPDALPGKGTRPRGKRR